MVIRTLFFLTMVGIIIAKSIWPAGPDPVQVERILEATVIITMIAPECEEGPENDGPLPTPLDEHRDMARPERHVIAEGLGTLATADNGDLLIITHDHWSLLDSLLGTAQILDGRGQLLTEMPLWAFRDLIQYRDGATMLLSWPEGLAISRSADRADALARLTERSSVAVGDVVSLAHRQPGGQMGVSVTQAVVESVGENKGRPVLRLDCARGTVIAGGDSGGGVWHQGTVVGNLWMTIMEKDVRSGGERPTSRSYAARISDAWTAH
jgi:hypothetical protein